MGKLTSLGSATPSIISCDDGSLHAYDAFYDQLFFDLYRFSSYPPTSFSVCFAQSVNTFVCENRRSMPTLRHSADFATRFSQPDCLADSVLDPCESNVLEVSTEPRSVPEAHSGARWIIRRSPDVLREFPPLEALRVLGAAALNDASLIPSRGPLDPGRPRSLQAQITAGPAPSRGCKAPEQLQRFRNGSGRPVANRCGDCSDPPRRDREAETGAGARGATERLQGGVLR